MSDFKLISGFKVKEVNSESDVITIEGYANTTDKDRHGDIILSEAWTKGGMDNFLKNPIVLAFHDHKRPVGQVVDYSVDKKGLKVVAEIHKVAGDVFKLVKKNILRTFSVGFRVKDAVYDEQTDTFLIKDLELGEISIVSVPANADSTFSVKKSFDSDEEYNIFKGEFYNMPTENKGPDKVKELESKLEKQAGDISAVLELLQEQAAEKAAKEKAEAEAKEKASAAALAKEGAERLLEEVEKRFEDKEKNFSEALEGLRAELKEKSSELEALTKNKMVFNDKNTANTLSNDEIDKAVLVAKLTGKSISDTRYGSDIIEKAGAHMGGMGTPSDWEKEFSTRIYSDMQDKLIVEPLFDTINMSTPTLEIPINPEAGIASWITSANYGTANSTGSAQTHTLYNRTLNAHKLASKEYIGYEEDEDTILAIVPIIRKAVVRRMSRSSDIAMLRGKSGIDSGDTSLWPFDGVGTIADAAGNTTTLSVAGNAKLTVLQLSKTRRTMGKYGLNPNEVRYIVSTEAYYDLLEDPEFRTVDLAGSNATVLTGQVGFANGSPVIVSDSFAPKAVGAVAAVAVNVSNFIVGSLRGMMVERDRDIEQQKNILVATRRFGFMQLTTGAGEGVGAVKYIT